MFNDSPYWEKCEPNSDPWKRSKKEYPKGWRPGGCVRCWGGWTNAPKNNSGESNITKAVTMTKTALDINYLIILSSLGNVLQAILSIIYRACYTAGRSYEDYLNIYHSLFPLRF